MGRKEREIYKMAADRKEGIYFALLAVLLWATLGTGLKLAVTALDSFSAAVWIGVFATLALGIYLLIIGKGKILVAELKKNIYYFVSAGIIGLGVQQILYLKSFSLLPASEVVILFYTYPLLIVIFSVLFFKEKISTKSFLLILLGFLGTYIVLTGGKLVVPTISIGALLTLLAAASWALFSAMMKHRDYDEIVGMFFFNLFGLIFLLALTPLYKLNLPASGGTWLGIIYLAIFPTALAFVLWSKALHLASSVICSNIALLTPFFSIVVIAIVLHETILVAPIIGLAIIIISILLNLNTKTKKIPR